MSPNTPHTSTEHPLEATAADERASNEHTSDEQSAVQTHRPPRRWLIVGYGVLMAVLALALVVMWVAWSPSGQMIAVRNLITNSMVLFGFLLTVGWLLVARPMRERAAAVTLLLLCLPLAAWAVSIRHIENDGDMSMIFAYRWDPVRNLQTPQPTAPVSLRAEPLEITAADMPAYRGVDRDGILEGPPLDTKWRDGEPEVLWRTDVGGGYASCAVVDDILITLEQRGSNEAVTCYSTATGELVWLHEYRAYFREAMGGDGPRSTPTISSSDVFTYGAEGDLHCLDVATGKPRWHVNALEIAGIPNTTWGQCSSPLIIDEKVIVNPGAWEGDGLIAFHRETGEVIWKGEGIGKPRNSSSGNHAGYSSPQLSTIHGVEQIVMFDAKGVRGCDIQTGKTLWSYDFENAPGVNVAQPIVFPDGRVFISVSYGVGCAMLQVEGPDRWAARPLWANNNMECKFTSPILHEGAIYGLDEGILVCLDPETGERHWKRGRYGHGQMLLSDGTLIILSEQGELALVEPTPEEFREIARTQVLSSPKVWNPPALARGRLYARSAEEMVCLDLTQ